MAGSPNTLVVAQSGGPSPVVNASVVGALLAARTDRRIQRVLGARFGFEGMLAGDWIDLTGLNEQDIDLLRVTPGAALGSSRHRPSEAEIDRTVADLVRTEVGWITMIGGNDSAETLHRLHLAARKTNAPLAIVGIPKTVDNDLPGMDHSPGYGSAARYIAMAVREAALDTTAMRRTDPVKIFEVAGRNAGWLAAASSLARAEPADAPDIIFLPERPRSVGQMLEEIRTAYAARGWVIVVISENQRDDEANALGKGDPIHVDPHGHAYFETAGTALARMSHAQLGLRTRYERPGSLQRTSVLSLSDVDVREAELVGGEAVRWALNDASDVMVAMVRSSADPYAVDLTKVPLESIAHQEQKLPDEMIAASGTDVTEAFLSYARPLIGGALPPIHRPFV